MFLAKSFTSSNPKSFTRSNPEGMALCQPRVERREGDERRATLGYEFEVIESPNGAALTAGFFHD